jgi:TPR repeat protein
MRSALPCSRRTRPWFRLALLNPEGSTQRALKRKHLRVPSTLPRRSTPKKLALPSSRAPAPGRRNGRPIASRLTLSLQFKIFGADTQKFLDLSDKARSGDPTAEFELANAFFEGRDIPKDESQGMALLERAARRGYPQAQFQMGERFYGDGNNPQSYVVAYYWYAQARRSGNGHADAKVTELESRMTPDQLTEARKRLEGSLTSAK